MNRKTRAGFTLLEMTIAAGLLAVLFGVLGKFVSRWEAARRAADERAFALRTLENVLERTVAGETPPESLSGDTNVASRLRSPQLQFRRGEPDDLGLVPMTATLSWQNAEGQKVSPIIITVWKRGSAGRTEASR